MIYSGLHWQDHLIALKISSNYNDFFYNIKIQRKQYVPKKVSPYVLNSLEQKVNTVNLTAYIIRI